MAERPADDLHRLLEDLTIEQVGRGLIRVVLRTDRHTLVVEVQDLARHRAAPDAQHCPATRQVVQRGEVFGEPHRVPLRHHVEHGTETQLRGLGRNPRRDQQPVGDDLVALVLEMVLGSPERIETEPLGFLGRVDVVERGLPAVVVRVSPVHRIGETGARIVHLDAPEEEGTELEILCSDHAVYVRTDGIDDFCKERQRFTTV